MCSKSDTTFIKSEIEYDPLQTSIDEEMRTWAFQDLQTLDEILTLQKVEIVDSPSKHVRTIKRRRTKAKSTRQRDKGLSKSSTNNKSKRLKSTAVTSDLSSASSNVVSTNKSSDIDANQLYSLQVFLEDEVPTFEEPFDTPFKCKVCNLCFEYFNDLEGHLQTSKEQHHFKCYYCGEIFKEYKNFCFHHTQKHDKRPQNGKLYTCQLCNIRQIVFVDYLNHLRKHKTMDPFICDDCGTSFFSEILLQYHRKQQHIIGILTKNTTCSNDADKSEAKGVNKNDASENVRPSRKSNEIKQNKVKNLVNLIKKNDDTSEEILPKTSDGISLIPVDSKNVPESIRKLLQRAKKNSELIELPGHPHSEVLSANIIKDISSSISLIPKLTKKENVSSSTISSGNATREEVTSNISFENASPIIDVTQHSAITILVESDDELPNTEHLNPFEHPFDCSACNLEFELFIDLDKHLINSTAIHSFKCEFDGRIFKQYHLYLNHYAKEHQFEKYKCIICLLTVDNFKDFISHIRRHKTKTPHTCDNYNATSFHQTDLSCQKNKFDSVKRKSHEIEVTKNSKPIRRPFEPPFKCSVCNLDFEFYKDLEKHLQSSTVKHRFLCEYDKMIFKNYDSYFDHNTKNHQMKKYVCSMCHMTLIYFKDFITHIRKHKTMTPITCDNCDERFFYEWHLLHHKKKIHKIDVESKIETLENSVYLKPFTPPFKCSVCKLDFEFYKDLETHLESSPVKHSFICEYDQHIFEHYDLYCEHYIVNHQGEQRQCNICQVLFITFNDYINHIGKHNKEMQAIPCDDCDKEFFFLWQLKDHKYQHHGGSQCELCEKKFPYQSRLVTHRVREHNGCRHCDQYFEDKDSLEEHLSKSHDDLTFPCIPCDQIFSSFEMLKRHRREHNENDLLCPYCGKTFQRRTPFEKHVSSHGHYNDIDGWACGRCDEAFETLSDLETHELRIHTGKSCMCEICGKILSSSHQLEHHIMGHQGVKLLECDVCHRKFRRLTTLKHHRRRHFKEKPYECSLCGEKFSVSQLVKKHVEKKHPGCDASFSCNSCDRKFATNVHLKYHIRLRHSKKPETHSLN